ncbi:MAG TPA: EAL domain-containing protein [Jatrophihabitans sp.]|nr:EAL domain-containing protein [Jatrophihabitans sp.]
MSAIPVQVLATAAAESRVGALAFDVPRVDAAEPVLGVERLFRREPLLRGVLVAGPGPDRYLSRERLDAALSGPFGYGRSLHARATAGELAPAATLTVAAELDLPATAGHILQRPAAERYADLLVLAGSRTRVVTASAVFERLSAVFGHIALHDPLTGLPNRRLLDQRAAQLLAAGQAPAEIAILYVDLDGFKLVNDTLGHRAGDQILVEFAQRLRTCVRPADVIARLGGDEFAVLLAGVSEAQALAIAERLVLVASAGFVIEDEPVHISASVGIVTGAEARQEQGLTQLDALLRLADGAMLRAKRNGKRRVERILDRADGDSLARRALIRRGLRRALTDDRGLSLHYQSKLEMATGDASSVEALLRWSDVELGPVSPAEFIPIAEESDQIFELGRWVLDRACEQAAAWLDAGRPRIVSVNVSPVQFRDPQLAGVIARTLQLWSLPAALLRIEITESSAIIDFEASLAQLAALRRVGVEVELDDFGTGYSSLSMLRELPLTAVKIDKSFIDCVDASPADAALVRGVIEAAHALGLTVTAEGVERPQQLAVLRELGCDTAQGFLIGRPAPAGQLPPASVPDATQALAAQSRR